MTRSTWLLLALATALGSAEAAVRRPRAAQDRAHQRTPAFARRQDRSVHRPNPSISTQNTKPKQIYTVPLRAERRARSPRKATDNERPDWSPDSRHIAFISDRGGSAQIWIMNADGS